jgi:GDPmannose 4,6-dehydratase
VSAKELGIQLEFSGAGVDEVAKVKKIEGDKAPALKVGETIVRIDPRYFRPTEVETLLGDPSLAKKELGWIPEIKVFQLCNEMIGYDLEQAKQLALLKNHGFKVNISTE